MVTTVVFHQKRDASRGSTQIGQVVVHSLYMEPGVEDDELYEVEEGMCCLVEEFQFLRHVT